jgi:hypothetical protein
MILSRLKHAILPQVDRRMEFDTAGVIITPQILETLNEVVEDERIGDLWDG